MLGRLKRPIAGKIRVGGTRTELGPSRQATSWPEEAIECYRAGGYHPVRLGDVFADQRYRVVNKLGHGQYATVWLAFDKIEKRHVALKILSADSYGTEKDTFELEVLKVIRTANGKDRGRSHIVGLLDHFKHRGPHGVHVCIVLEAMGPDMSAIRKEFPKLQVPLPLLKAISRHVLLALAYLHGPCRVIHTDIKPSNILVETLSLRNMFQHAPSEVLSHSSDKLDEPFAFYMKSEKITADEDNFSSVKGISARLADFGTASFFNRHLTENIQPVMLRAPEVLLGAEWKSSVDIWNLGLVIWELAEGKVLFDGRATPDAQYSVGAHLAQIETVLGPMPKDLLSRSSEGYEFYSSAGILNSPSPSRTGSLGSFTERLDLVGDEKDQFLDFVGAMLRLAPEKRATATDLLRMPWLQD